MGKLILEFLQSLTMECPAPFGPFHIACLVISAACVITFALFKGKIKERTIFLVYGFGSLILEILKQYMWSFTVVDGELVLDFPWAYFPFQFCSTPMYVCIILAFLKEGKLKKALIDYLSYFTIISAVMVMLLPDSCFCTDLEVNIHTMYLHCGSFVVGSFLIINRKEETDIKGFLHGLSVFLVMVSIAMTMNITFYKTGIIDDWSFNMFYISPYFTSSLPVFDSIQAAAPYPVFLLSYLLSVSGTAFGINRIIHGSLNRSAVRVKHKPAGLRVKSV